MMGEWEVTASGLIIEYR